MTWSLSTSKHGAGCTLARTQQLWSTALGLLEGERYCKNKYDQIGSRKVSTIASDGFGLTMCLPSNSVEIHEIILFIIALIKPRAMITTVSMQLRWGGVFSFLTICLCKLQKYKSFPCFETIFVWGPLFLTCQIPLKDLILKNVNRTAIQHLVLNLPQSIFSKARSKVQINHHHPLNTFSFPDPCS